MVWIPDGTLLAGTPRDRVPRVADEEPPGTPVAMHGFYIDVLPYPNESGAIATTNVSRDEAARLCAAKEKRLCTEFEWEMACKGPTNTSYEYGSAYRSAVCGTGLSSDEAARRPVGERPECKSAFGVMDLHGGAWEWTASSWSRGGQNAGLGVLKGGNALAGELVGRCANAMGRAPAARTAAFGFRCCAGPPNEPAMPWPAKTTLGLETVRDAEGLYETWEPVLRPVLGAQSNHFARAWTWRPVSGEELTVLVVCDAPTRAVCAGVVGLTTSSGPTIIASADLGRAVAVPDAVRLGDARNIRLRGLDTMGTFGRDVRYVYGRVEFRDVTRP